MREAQPRRWRAAASPGGLIGILGLLLSVLLAGGSLAVLAGRVDAPVWSPLVWLGLILGLAGLVCFGFLLYGYGSISYELTPSSAVIRWGRRSYVVPFESIQEIVPAGEVVGEADSGWRPFWSGYYVHQAESALGPVQVVATLPRRRQLWILTGDGAFAISPERPIRYVEEYARLRGSFDPERPATSVLDRPRQHAARISHTGQFPRIDQPPAREPAAQAPPVAASAEVPVSPMLRPQLLTDTRSLVLLAAAVLLNLMMVIYILTQYETLPPAIALHWNVNGFPDVIGSPREIWTIPVITGLVTLANVVLAWSVVTFDRFAARLLLGGSVLVQLVAWVGLLTIIG